MGVKTLHMPAACLLRPAQSGPKEAEDEVQRRAEESERRRARHKDC